MSGVRSIVRALAEDDFDRLEHIRWCPVQFQALVPGTDVRVHVIEEDVHATEIISDTLDYRYARRAGGAAELRPIQLSSDTQEKCVALTRGLGLAFAGIDLKVTPAGEIFCFEVNPSPAFSFTRRILASPSPVLLPDTSSPPEQGHDLSLAAVRAYAATRDTLGATDQWQGSSPRCSAGWMS